MSERIETLTNNRGIVFEIYDTVEVPEPNSDDLYNHSFRGTIIGFRDEFALVEDMEENVFDIEIDRLISDEE